MKEAFSSTEPKLKVVTNGLVNEQRDLQPAEHMVVDDHWVFVRKGALTIYSK